MKLVSACLWGVNCAWNGKSKLNPKALELMREGDAIPVCPEQLGGCTTPRLPAEIKGGDGAAVLAGRSRVENNLGQDVTANFRRGAQETLHLARMVGATEFIAKAKSPSCGCGRTYDGSFSGKLVAGDGVTTALLKQNGIKVICDDEL